MTSCSSALALAATLAELPEKPAVTAHLNIHGFHKHANKFENLASYGSDSRHPDSQNR